MRPFGKSQSKITAVSTTVDQQRPDSHLIHQLIHIFDEIGLHIDSMRWQENTNMVRGNTKPAPWGKPTKYKCPAPAQKGLLSGLVEGVGLDNDRIRKINNTAFNYLLF